MSAFSGRQFKGAARTHRQSLRAEAEARNAATPPGRRRSSRRGCPTHKHRYPGEHEARVELVGTGIARNLGKNQRRECRVYECPLCAGWHLTSKPLRSAS